MKTYLCFGFHVIALIHHLFAAGYTLFFDFSKTSDPEILKLDQYRYRFFTSWNFTLQTVYFSLALLHDVLQKTRLLKRIDQNLVVAKGYLFTSLIFPSTLYVGAMFWIIFNVNREWVLPGAADLIVPQWFNHSVHTNIIVALIMEMLLVNNQFVPDFKSAFIGLSVYTIVYDSTLVLTYFESGRWLYGMFYMFNWTERIVFFVVNYLINVFLLKMGIHMRNNVKFSSKTMPNIKAN